MIARTKNALTLIYSTKEMTQQHRMYKFCAKKNYQKLGRKKNRFEEHKVK